MHEQVAFRKKCIEVGDYENTVYLKEKVISLPIHSYMKKDDVLFVTQLF